AAPEHEAGVLELLSSTPGETEVLAGGTDLVGLMKKLIVNPDRVVNIMEVPTLRGISADSTGVTIGATTRLDDMLEAPELDDYPSIKQAIGGIASPQLQQQGTLGGELCQRPRCWYFRNGHGLLAHAGRMVAEGENRFHAIFGNAGPAKFVHPSRLAPALIALGTQVRIAGPGPNDETLLPLEQFFRAPRHEGQREHVLAPDQLLTHMYLPPADGIANAAYEVRHGTGPDYPLTAAAAALWFQGPIVVAAKIVMGHVAPTPWVSLPAAEALVGRVVNRDTARAAGEAAVAEATPLSDNGYKVRLARVAVERAILLAAGLETGGF
ncbi:MAG TPA: FAD binding domain-containing protein, partial [Pirellulales bacterium]|nr:FAD binding domain-containing protein [Pirellulales bacterium]